MRRPGGKIQGHPLTLDASRCPLCGGANACVMESASPGEPCWCQRAEFGEALLAQVPEAARRKACICARCALADEAPAAPIPGSVQA
ncbi:MAG: cysteine-rich CWC family protein [Betaproteobacteria bacterium]